MKRLLYAFVALTGLAGSVLADAALIIGNEDYASRRDLRDGADITNAADELGNLGFDVIARQDASSSELIGALDQFVGASVGSKRVLVILAGRFMNSGRETWLLGVDADETPTLAGLAGSALPLSSVMVVLQAHPGRAMLMIVEDDETAPVGSPYIYPGLGPMELPQGVTLVRGEARAMAGFAEDVLPLPAMAQALLAARQQGLTVEGFAPDDYRFLDPEALLAEGRPSGDEALAWRLARSADAIASYQDFIARFPESSNIAEAKRLISEIQTEPNRAARLVEEALGLSRDQKQAVQRNLSMLDIDPRGIDGLFGPGSRAAIAKWQATNGETATGYLTREQAAALELQATRRAAELEAQAEARRLEQERQDRTYWNATGAAGDEPGLRAYLKRYPDGVFAEVAQTRLDVFEEQKRAAAAQADRLAWDKALAGASVQSYRDYLSAFPQGAFAAEAQARIEDLTVESGSEEANATARQAEEALGLNRQTRQLIEQRLDALGLKPGEIDGEFDKSTRRAIRRYQQSRDIPVTGYLSQQTVVRILADSALR
jgi:peptidoglycan hydrolase-like protein with peptidoglycan-binding domain